jgi:hypothetical protein
VRSWSNIASKRGRTPDLDTGIARREGLNQFLVVDSGMGGLQRVVGARRHLAVAFSWLAAGARGLHGVKGMDGQAAGVTVDARAY